MPRVPAEGAGAPRWARPFVWSLLSVLLGCGVIGVEEWPLSAFRLFSHVRPSRSVTWQLSSVDAAGTERALRFSSLPAGYRGLDLDLDDAARWRPADRDELCAAIVTGARRTGRDVATVRVYEVERDLSHRIGRTSAATARLAFMCLDLAPAPGAQEDLGAGR